MRRVVHRQRLKPEQRADRKRESAWQPDADERRGQHEQQSEEHQPQLGPELEPGSAHEIERGPRHLVRAVREHPYRCNR